MENPIEIDDLGVPLFQETTIWLSLKMGYTFQWMGLQSMYLAGICRAEHPPSIEHCPEEIICMDVYRYVGVPQGTTKIGQLHIKCNWKFWRSHLCHMVLRVNLDLLSEGFFFLFCHGKTLANQLRDTLIMNMGQEGWGGSAPQSPANRWFRQICHMKVDGWSFQTVRQLLFGCRNGQHMMFAFFESIIG